MHLVPLDLVGNDRWNEVVEVGGGGDVGGEDVAAVPVPAAPAPGGGDGFPGVEFGIARADEGPLGLTEDDVLDVDDAGRNAVGRVEKGVEVWLGFLGAGVERGFGGEVGRLEGGDTDGAGALEQGGIGAGVQFDLAPSGHLIGVFLGGERWLGLEVPRLPRLIGHQVMPLPRAWFRWPGNGEFPPVPLFHCVPQS